MEKLIELLNEYDPYIASDGERRDNLWGYAYQWHSAVFPKELAESYIISARYGFIKWLVENDKIDKKKIRSPIMHYKVEEDREGWIHYYDLDFANKTNSLIMLLSISSSPIEDLISYLK